MLCLSEKVFNRIGASRLGRIKLCLGKACTLEERLEVGLCAIGDDSVGFRSTGGEFTTGCEICPFMKGIAGRCRTKLILLLFDIRIKLLFNIGHRKTRLTHLVGTINIMFELCGFDITIGRDKGCMITFSFCYHCRMDNGFGIAI